MKRIILLCICLIEVIGGFAQDSPPLLATELLSELPAPSEPFNPEWAFGFNGGMTFSKVSFNPVVKQDMLQQFAGGLTVRYISEKNIGLQLELNYSMRGWMERTDSLNRASTALDDIRRPLLPEDRYKMIYTNYSRSLAYFEVPVLTHIYFDMGRRARVLFLMGPQVGCYLNEKTQNAEIYNAYPLESTPNHELKVQRRFDYGLLGGIGVEFRTGIGSFIIDGRYYYGLSDVLSNHKSDYFQASSNQVMSVKAAYLFVVH
ncbi:MAG: PorT family protein [Dysgonamonadaceae bacterium]|nr:PorT family protein [Dysgonamonadaceae bacterium]